MSLAGPHGARLEILNRAFYGLFGLGRRARHGRPSRSAGCQQPTSSLHHGNGRADRFGRPSVFDWVFVATIMVSCESAGCRKP